MLKISQEQALTARRIGVALACRDLGYSPEAIKLAFESQGMTKEAVVPALGAILASLGRIGAMFGGRVALRGASRLLSKWLLQKSSIGALRAGVKGMEMATGKGLLKNLAGRTLFKVAPKFNTAGKMLSDSALAFGESPGKALWQGTKNFGKGTIYFGGKGTLGGTLGRGTALYGLGSAVAEGRVRPPRVEPVYYGGY